MSSRYAFLGTPRWYRIIAGAIAVACVCSLLGYWQWTRYESRAEAIDLVEANYTQDPAGLRDLIPALDAPLAPGHEWRPVIVTGRYLGSALVLPQRGVEGSPADHVVGLFAAEVSPEESWVILVDRGWYRTDSFADHTEAQRLPEGQVELVFRLRPAEPASSRTLTEGQLHRLNPAQAVEIAFPGADLAHPYAAGFYGQLAGETRDGASVFPEELNLLPRPAANLGSHLSYALQWWAFALGILAAVVVFARREARDVTYTPRRRGEDDEDEAIDAQLQAKATSSA